MSLRISPMSNIRQEIQDIQEIQGITEPNTIRRTLADCQQILQETRSVEMNRWHHATSAEAVGDINCTAQTSLTPSPVGGVDMLHWMQQQKATALQELPPTGLGKFQPPTYTAHWEKETLEDPQTSPIDYAIWPHEDLAEQLIKAYFDFENLTGRFTFRRNAPRGNDYYGVTSMC